MPNDITDIIIIRGAPGSGKSQTAKCLSNFFPQGVRLEVDALRKMVISVDWTNQEEHINMLEVSTCLVQGFLKLGFKPVIVIDTFSGDKINKYLETLYQLDKNFKIKLFGLFTTDEELKRRLKMRTNAEFNDYAICKKINDDVLNIKHEEEHQIDTTGLWAKETAEIIYEHLKVGKG